MQQLSLLKLKNLTKAQEAIMATLVFFGIHDIPLTQERVWLLLYKYRTSKEEAVVQLANLVKQGKIFEHNGFHSLKPIDPSKIIDNDIETAKKLARVKKYYWLLCLIPFVEHVSLINSLAMGNTDAESDIDFFVITKPGKLYFVRSLVIIIFRLLGIYKTKKQIADRFCFGFYVTTDSLDLSEALIEGEDPHFAFWFASFLPLFGKRQYERLVAKNRWVYDYCPNFLPSQKIQSYMERPRGSLIVKRCSEILLTIPALLFEPVARFIHIRHTWRLPENSWPTSTTIAEKDMLKLHAVDPRAQIRERFEQVLQSLR